MVEQEHRSLARLMQMRRVGRRDLKREALGAGGQRQLGTGPGQLKPLFRAGHLRAVFQQMPFQMHKKIGWRGTGIATRRSFRIEHGDLGS
ncbi:hypothetical protein [Paenirhodobacter populi]|uniref:hypothetical protein n=1 Tax=Paenirhodobacter populi TaxID=2306993 RepID=UPI001F4F3FC0|nr:hypothetical protein [Sinirhodobacter populi]